MSAPPIRRWDRETALLAWLTACVSIFSFLFYFRRGDVLLYGDAVAHINIARRVFDSRTPGLLQLGTVWLPLPHLLTLPFLFSDWMWKTGVGGSIPSMAAYVFGAVGMFRLVGGMLGSQNDNLARTAAWGAALVFAANPNLIYLQATAMTEPLYLALFIWAVVYFDEFVRGAGDAGNLSRAQTPLVKCGVCLAAACWTRYDGWFLAAAMSAACLAVKFRTKVEPSPALNRSLRNFMLLAAAAPALWLAYNALVYRNALEFVNGPYSAKAIELRSPSESHPGKKDLRVAIDYFLKSAEMNLGAGNWQKVWILLAVAGVMACLSLGNGRAAASRVRSNGEAPASDGEGELSWGQPARLRRQWVVLLLWMPLPFYVLSIAYGGVPLFIPVWWPFSYYNARYGLELLPAFAVFAVLAVHWLAGRGTARAKREEPTSGAEARSASQKLSGMSKLMPFSLRSFSFRHVLFRDERSFVSKKTAAWSRNFKLGVALVALVFVAASYSSIWKDPVCLREAGINSGPRIALEGELASFLKGLPPDSTLLMYLGNHVGALQQAGIPLRRVINEGNHRTWKQPIDMDGLWERALSSPAQYADFAIGFEGDEVSRGLKKQSLVQRSLVPLAVFRASGQPAATVYQTRVLTK